MHQILILLLVCRLTHSAGKTCVAGTYLGTNLDETLECDETATELCQLPPYPADGGYIVLNEKHAKPGDSFANVSLVQYTTDDDRKVFEIKRLTCSLGEWYQDIMEYQSTLLQFYTSWCPFFCSCLSGDKWTGECSSINVKRNPQELNRHLSMADEGSYTSKENYTTSTVCRLPPYPARGTFIVPDHPDAKPGDVFQEISLILFTKDPSSTTVGIEHFRCSGGTWRQKIFREVSEKLQFHTSWCPALCSDFFGEGRTAKTGYNTYEFSKETDQRTIQENYCILPPYPKFGNYSVLSASEPWQPGDAYDVLRLNYTCESGHSLTGSRNVYCLNGTWSNDLPTCTKLCHLNQQPGVEYLCESVESEGKVTPCKDRLEDGSTIYPQCTRPYYKPKSSLKPMTCVNGEWDSVARCEPVCGLLFQSPGRVETDARVRAPWNVAVYNVTSDPYRHICGGSIVAPNLVISGAGCFHNNSGKLKAPVEFIVAAGKLYRSFHDPNDDQAQIRNVTKIIIPPRFFGELTSYQDDIALVFLSTSFVFNKYVLPICVNFDATFDRIQLSKGRVGQVAGWGRSDIKQAKNVLQIVDLPTASVEKCLEKTIYQYNTFVSGDKMCGGYANGVALCGEDNGAGFTFAETDRSDPRRRYHFLRGIVSGYMDYTCDGPFTTLTMLSWHRHFVVDNSDGLIK